MTRNRDSFKIDRQVARHELETNSCKPVSGLHADLVDIVETAFFHGSLPYGVVGGYSCSNRSDCSNRKF